mmetsp:Transcript_7321/g.14332  ORF Transcript_7321/g.14332 Transcript_7321/m.14332 type:complete len:148 (-) Transcript_7321:1319-1762(-)
MYKLDDETRSFSVGLEKVSYLSLSLYVSINRRTRTHMLAALSKNVIVSESFDVHLDAFNDVPLTIFEAMFLEELHDVWTSLRKICSGHHGEKMVFRLQRKEPCKKIGNVSASDISRSLRGLLYKGHLVVTTVKNVLAVVGREHNGAS